MFHPRALQSITNQKIMSKRKSQRSLTERQKETFLAPGKRKQHLCKHLLSSNKISMTYFILEPLRILFSQLVAKVLKHLHCSKVVLIFIESLKRKLGEVSKSSRCVRGKLWKYIHSLCQKKYRRQI